MGSSGKSTQVPQILLDAAITNGEADCCKIIVTQPRRIAAVGVAERVSFERGEKVGNSVGYQIRMEQAASRNTKILFCTTGILLRKLQDNMYFRHLSCIIVDEVSLQYTLHS